MPSYPNTADTTIAVGDHVRSFDFFDNGEHYVEGVVTHILKGEGHFRVVVSKHVVGGVHAQNSTLNGKIVMPPINGEEGFFGITRGVERIT